MRVPRHEPGPPETLTDTDYANLLRVPDRRTLAEIAVSTRSLSERVREGSIAPRELTGGTFTISNLGMFGMARFSAVIHDGQAAILGVGAALPRIVPDLDGAPVSRRIVELIDKYGAKGARTEIAAIKVAAPAMATAVIDRAIEVFGGMGVSDDTPLAYFYAWARSLRIADGPDAVHRRSIAREELRRERPFVG